MIKKIQQLLFESVESIHATLFGHKMSTLMINFIGHLSWSFFGGISAAIIMLIVNVLAGRWLGPIGFGQYNFLLSLAVSTTIIFLLGNNSSSIRYISDKKYLQEKDSILTASLILTIIQIFTVTFIIYLLREKIVNIFGLKYNQLNLVYFFGIVLSIKELFDSYLRSLNLIKNQSFIKIADSIVVISVFVISYKLSHVHFSYASYVYAFISGGIFSIICSMLIIKKYFVKIKWSHMLLILNYNKFIVLASIGTIAISLEKIIIGKVIGIENLGIYSAYYSSSQLVLSNLTILFMNIFWPTVIHNIDKLNNIISKSKILIYKFSPIIFIINCISIFCIMKLYGNQYPINYLSICLFSLSSILSAIFFITISLLNINQIKVSTTILICAYFSMLLSLIIFKNIFVYLSFQIMIYGTCIGYGYRILKIDKK